MIFWREGNGVRVELGGLCVVFGGEGLVSLGLDGCDLARSAVGRGRLEAVRTSDMAGK